MSNEKLMQDRYGRASKPGRGKVIALASVLFAIKIQARAFDHKSNDITQQTAYGFLPMNRKAHGISTHAGSARVKLLTLRNRRL